MGSFSKKSVTNSYRWIRIPLFHSVAVVFSAVNVYAFLYNISMVQIAPDIIELLEKHIRINPWKYMTFWNMVLQCGYFSLALLTDVMGLDVTLRSNQRRLEYVRDITFASWLFPVGTWVCTSFWGLYWMYSDLILPEKMALMLPFWVNHGTHTMPAVFAVLELCLVRHRYPNRIAGLSYLISIFVGYLIYMVSSSVNTGVWPYPFLTELPPAHLTVIISTLTVSAIVKYTIGESLHTLMWGNDKGVKRGKSFRKGMALGQGKEPKSNVSMEGGKRKGHREVFSAWDVKWRKNA